jgi:hypothetical protein
MAATEQPTKVAEPTEDPYMKFAKGRVPVSENAGAAKNWCPDGIPKPDRSHGTLWWTSFFGIGSALGLTDFYLRSPLTGIIKIVLFVLLSAGTSGIGAIPLLLWGVYEFLHIWFEKARVVNYGMSTPFNIVQGVGQGMITDQPTNYTQNANYTIWQVMSLFGFVGADAFYAGKPALGLRKFFDGMFFLLYIGMIVHLATQSITGNLGWIIVFGILAIVLSVFVVPIYYTSFTNAISSPTDLFNQPSGGSTDGSIVSVYNFMNAWTSVIGTRTATRVRDGFGIVPQGGDYYREIFEIRHRSNVPPPTEKRSSSLPSLDDIIKQYPMPVQTLLKKAASLGQMTSILPLILGPMISGLLVASVSWIPLPLPFGLSIGNILELTYGLQDVLEGKGSIEKLLEEYIPGFGAASGIVGAGGLVGSALSSAANPIGKLSAAKGVAGGLVGSALSSAANPIGKLSAAKGVAGGLVGSALSSAANPIDAASEIVGAISKNSSAVPNQTGGARSHRVEEPSLGTEAIALGATVAVLVAGGAIKLAVDSLVPQ